MIVIELLKELNLFCHFQTREGKKTGPVSNSELKRWWDNKAVVINGGRPAWNSEIEFPVESMILFPKNPVTLW